jgi:hypothetical protein
MRSQGIARFHDRERSFFPRFWTHSFFKVPFGQRASVDQLKREAMPRVNFATTLSRFYPNLSSQNVEAESIQELLRVLDRSFENFCQYISG